jgi:cysteine-rich repeat protein
MRRWLMVPVLVVALGASPADGEIPPGGLLLVPESTNKRVMAFDPATGALVNADFVPADATHLSTPICAILNADATRILVSDQINDVVQAYDLNGTYVGVFAPAGGADTSILDNIRGIALRPNGNLLVTVGGGTNTDAVAEFDTTGAHLGNFVAAAAGGLGSPFDVLLLPDRDTWLVGGINSDMIHRYGLTGAPLTALAGIDGFPEQIARAANGNVLVANFSGTQEGVVELTADGALVDVHTAPGLGGYRGVWELANGNLLTTTGTGVHEINRMGNLVQTKMSGVSARFIELATVCGDGIVQGSEQCDDGNTVAGDCCAPDCTFEVADSACPDDGEACTQEACDGAGTCLHSAAPAGTACADDDDACTIDRCDGGTCVHAAEPSTACRLPIRAHRSFLELHGGTRAARHRLAWRWRAGAETTAADLGDPLAETAAELCLFDGEGLVARSVVPAGAGWRKTKKGFRFRGSADGIRRLVLVAGGAGKAKITVAGKGSGLEMPDLSGVVAPLTVQLHAGDACWGTAYELGKGTKRGKNVLRARD